MKTMFFQLVTVLLISISLGTNGIGTKYNYFPFVELGSNGVSYSSLYHYSSNYEIANSISPPIKMGSEESFQDAYVNLHGAISFLSSVDDYYNQPFRTYSSDEYIIAPFWAGMVFGSNGHVRFEVHNMYTNSASLKSRVANYISSTLGVYTVVESLLIVEWKGMEDFSASEETNTFQAVIASSVTESYAIFTYQCGGMQWSNSDATIGFKASGGQYRNHPYSRDWHSQNPIACLNSPDSVWSNVVYKLGRTRPYPCESYQFGCTDGTCISASSNVCNGRSDCNDGTDELNCASWYTPSCRSSQFSCYSGGCVDSSSKCDGYEDCADGSDEKHCSSISTGAIIGISIAGVVIIFVFTVIIVTAIHRQVKQHNLRRAQFQRIRANLTPRPQPTPHTHTQRLYFHPKPGEWYQTVEGHWVQGPPPSYDPGTPLEGGAEVELIGGFGNSDETEVVTGVSSNSAVASVPPYYIPNDQSSPVNDVEPSATNEVGVVSEEGISLDNSASESSIVDNEDTPLIES